MEYINKEDFKKQISKLLVQKKNTSDINKIKDIDSKIEYLRKIRLESAVEDEFERMRNRSR